DGHGIGRSRGGLTTKIHHVVDGLDVDEVTSMFNSDRHTAEVRADEHHASVVGVTGVPAIQHQDRTIIAGASTPEQMRSTLNRIADRRSAATRDRQGHNH
ncbi:DsbA family oxidoreductase, partial [Brevibacterium picturae]|uniref:DsbA family oxidoreductase n=1 Tax=Brevibacterium picturae TaxID=260553 RepID=UPI0031F905C2